MSHRLVYRSMCCNHFFSWGSFFPEDPSLCQVDKLISMIPFTDPLPIQPDFPQMACHILDQHFHLCSHGETQRPWQMLFAYLQWYSQASISCKSSLRPCILSLVSFLKENLISGQVFSLYHFHLDICAFQDCWKKPWLSHCILQYYFSWSKESAYCLVISFMQGIV